MARWGERLILLADANILIDLAVVGRVGVLPAIGTAEVLDVVLEECDHTSQPTLRADVIGCGVTVVGTDVSWVGPARELRTPSLSLPDALNLAYARDHGRVLLAGDQPLREAARERGVEVHGTIWIVEQVVIRALVDPREICRWLELWPGAGRRLPKGELARLRRALGCPADAS
jgi:predicted nucleic acid-binding protein